MHLSDYYESAKLAKSPQGEPCVEFKSKNKVDATSLIFMVNKQNREYRDGLYRLGAKTVLLIFKTDAEAMQYFLTLSK